jgi:uncharacterized repeat protein (TIGR04138 family)
MEDLGSLLLRIQDESGIRADALETLLHMIRRLSLQYGIGGVGVHLEPVEVSEGFYGLCRERFGILARDVIAEWGLPEPRALGTALTALSEAGLLAWGEDDSPESYEELPDLPEEWPAPLGVPTFREASRWDLP